MNPSHAEIDRRQFLRLTSRGVLAVGAIPLLGPILAACGEDDPTALAVQLNWIKIVEFGPWFVADNRGYWVDEGLEVDLISGGPNIGNVEQLISTGASPVGIATQFFGFVDAINAGAEVTMLGAQYQTSPSGIISLASAPILTPEDIIGKTIGAGADRQREINAVLTIAGLPLDYTFQSIGFDPEALERGDIDALSGFVTNQALVLAARGHEVVSTPYGDLGLPGYANILMANNDYLADNRETVVKYMRGLVKGTLENEKDTDFGANLAVDEYGADLSLDIDQQKDENRLQQAFQNSPLTAEKGVLSVSADVIVDEMYPGVIAAGITDPPAPDTYLDTSILEEVHASL